MGRYLLVLLSLSIFIPCDLSARSSDLVDDNISWIHKYLTTDYVYHLDETNQLTIEPVVIQSTPKQEAVIRALALSAIDLFALDYELAERLKIPFLFENQFDAVPMLDLVGHAIESNNSTAYRMLTDTFLLSNPGLHPRLIGSPLNDSANNIDPRQTYSDLYDALNLMYATYDSTLKYTEIIDSNGNTVCNHQAATAPVTTHTINLARRRDYPFAELVRLFNLASDNPLEAAFLR